MWPNAFSTHLQSSEQNFRVLVVQKKHQAWETALVLDYRLSIVRFRGQVPQLTHHWQSVHHCLVSPGLKQKLIGVLCVYNLG